MLRVIGDFLRSTDHGRTRCVRQRTDTRHTGFADSDPQVQLRAPFRSVPNQALRRSALFL